MKAVILTILVAMTTTQAHSLGQLTVNWHNDKGPVSQTGTITEVIVVAGYNLQATNVNTVVVVRSSNGSCEIETTNALQIMQNLQLGANLTCNYSKTAERLVVVENDPIKSWGSYSLSIGK